MVKPLIALAPARSAANTYVNLFAQSIEEKIFSISHYDYSSAPQPGTRLLLLHWPNIFFSPSPEGQLRAGALLDSWLDLRAKGELKIVWIAHNPLPHDRDTTQLATPLLSRFMQSLDGVIHLSSYGRQVVEEMYSLSSKRSLLIAHGDYYSGFSIPPGPAPIYFGSVDPCRLLFFGQIRPYKGLENLIACANNVDRKRIELNISGFCSSSDYRHKLQSLARPDSCIKLDLYEDLLEGAHLERLVDRCHGVVLPYEKILHSGATMYALSRNRPVLAPALGSLGELNQLVGTAWLNLYTPPINVAALTDFVLALTSERPRFCDLSSQSWDCISEALNSFLLDLIHDV